MPTPTPINDDAGGNAPGRTAAHLETPLKTTRECELSSLVTNPTPDTGVAAAAGDSRTPKTNNHSGLLGVGEITEAASVTTTIHASNNNNRSNVAKIREIFQSEVLTGDSSPLSPRRPPRGSLSRRASGSSHGSNPANTTTNNNNNSSSRSINSEATATSTHSTRDTILASSLDWVQIDMDAARCTWHLLTGSQRAQRYQMERKRMRKVARAIRRKQRRLANLINIALVQSYRTVRGSGSSSSSIHRDPHNDRGTRSDPSSFSPMEKDNTLRYYQGYHDVACIVLSTLGGCRPVRLISGSTTSSFLYSVKNYNNSCSNSNGASLEAMTAASGLDMPAAVLLQISQSHFRDCMRANFVQLQTTMRLTILPLIAYFDPEVHDFLSRCAMEPFFALSWVITWFSHDIRDTDLVKRLFDVFVVSHPLMPIYLAVAMVCHPLNRQDVLQSSDDGDDFAAVHHALSSLPRNSSMVGWKYKPDEQGYMSDDDADEDDDMDYDDDFDESPNSSIGPMDSQSSVDTEFLRHEAATAAATVRSRESVVGAEAVSIVSSSMSSMFAARVPFQELIDSAIHFMERMPPRNLLGLATRYYGRETVQDMLHDASGISFFQPPPVWTRASTAISDHELKQQLRRDLSRNESTSSLQSGDSTMTDNDDYDDVNTDVLRRLWSEDRGKAMAAIAAGLSLGDDAERRRKKQFKKMMIGAVAVMIVAVVVGVALRNRSHQQLVPTASQQRGTIGEKSRDIAPASPSDSAPDTCSSSSDSFMVMATSSKTSFDYGRSNSGSSSKTVRMAVHLSKSRGDAFRVQNTFQAVQSQVFAQKNEVASAMVESVGYTALIVPNVPQLDVFLAVVLKVAFDEALIMGNRIQHVGTSMLKTHLSALAEKSKTIGSKTTPKEAPAMVESAGHTALTVANVPQLDVLLAVVLKVVFDEALIMGNRIQRVGASMLKTQLSALAANSKIIGAKTKLVASKSKDIIVNETRQAFSRIKLFSPRTHAIFPANMPRPELAAVFRLIKESLDIGSAQVKGSMSELSHSAQQKAIQFAHVMQSKSIQFALEIRSLAVLAANDLSAIQSVSSPMLSSSRLLMLNQEFSWNNFTNTLSDSMKNTMRDLAPALRKLQSKIFLDMRSSLKKAVNPQSVKNTLHGVSAAAMYTSFSMTEEKPQELSKGDDHIPGFTYDKSVTVTDEIREITNPFMVEDNVESNVCMVHS